MYELFIIIIGTMAVCSFCITYTRSKVLQVVASSILVVGASLVFSGFGFPLHVLDKIVSKIEIEQVYVSDEKVFFVTKVFGSDVVVSSPKSYSIRNNKKASDVANEAQTELESGNKVYLNFSDGEKIVEVKRTPIIPK